MIEKIRFIILTIALLSPYFFDGPAIASEPYDPLNTLMALNAAVVSVNSVVTTGDRIVLDQEYKNIINNLKLGEIESDYSIVDLYRQLMDSITSSTLRDEESKRFKQQYDSLQKRSLVRSMMSVRAYGGSITSFLGSLLVSGVSAYFGYQDQKTEIRSQLDESLWRLEREKIEDFNRLQKELLNASWTLLRQYNIPDEYRITQDNLQNYMKAIQEEEKSRAVRMFKRLERVFGMYPPFWYHFGAAAYSSGDLKLAEKCFDEFEKIWRPVLRRDPYLVSVIKYRIVMKGESLSKGQLEGYLDTLQDHVDVNDWMNNIFIGIAAFQMGEKDMAIDALESNIFFGVEEEISNALLQAVEAGSLDFESFSAELKQYLLMPTKTSPSTEELVKPKAEEIKMKSVASPEQGNLLKIGGLDNSDRREMLAIFNKVAMGIGKENLGVGKSIDEKKLKNAKESMGINRQDSTLVLYDSTMFGGNKEGVALTSRLIYGKRLFEDPVNFHWGGILRSSISLYNEELCIGPYIVGSVSKDHVAFVSALNEFRSYLRKKYSKEFASDCLLARSLVENAIVSWVNGDDENAVSFIKTYYEQGRDNFLPGFMATFIEKDLKEVPRYLRLTVALDVLRQTSDFYAAGFSADIFDEILPDLKTAGENNTRAQLVLGWLCFNEDKKKEADEYFLKGSTAGTDYQFLLGKMFDKGEFLPRDDTRALFWYREALKGKNANAKAKLREMYAYNRGNTDSEKEAVEGYKKQIAQGSVEATDEMGLMYYYGRGVEKSPIKAIEMFRKAAERGNVSSQYNLGLVFGYSDDFPKDYEEAYKWFYLAAMNGNAMAKEKVEDLEGVGWLNREKLSPESQARAKAVARALYEEYKNKK